ncbi:hypothetical protein O181_004620 [Austropuccinia psidii MF-1]|uniref:RNA helicase n=1 Tax=Austropuccinia psidii MF-1 TaxID=1389203 RepID=A0A9Q3GF09_9BASI|nr:hypothetical protein [Austropuccinia psidii MF-1]
MTHQGSSSGSPIAQSKQQDRLSFAQLRPSINPLLLSSLSALSIGYPTQIQKEFIPLALNGKDILARSNTGSGKTLAYALPILQTIIETKAKARVNLSLLATGTMAIILVPTRELSEQVTFAISSVCRAFGNQIEIEIVNLASANSARSRKKAAKTDVSCANTQPDLIISTPSRLLDKLRTTPIDLSALTFLVLDEADLILSYGHSLDDIKALLSGGGGGDYSWRFPTFYQSFLMSATMTNEVAQLQSLILRSPEILHVKESLNELNNLTQFSIKVPNQQDKFLLLYVILRLKLIKGKSLVFVNSTDKSYQLKLFLEKFGIRSGVLNAELPFNSRYHSVQEFNQGVFDYLIATDESQEEDIKQSSKSKNDLPDQLNLIPTQLATADESNISSEQSNPNSSKKRKNRDDTHTKTQDRATDYGVSRGIDFINVACVINFDLPLSPHSYTHRIGRTARAGRTGIALSFVLSTASNSEANRWSKLQASSKDIAKEMEMWQKIEAQQKERGASTKEYKFDMTQVEGFRYRMEDGLRAVTKAAVREARVKEIKNEVLNSTKLKSHFEENPNDLMFLKHDKPLHPTRIQPHMKHVPSYLIPKISKIPLHQAQDMAPGDEVAASTGEPISENSVKSIAAPFHKKSIERGKSFRGRGRGRGGGRGNSSRGGRKKDPLKSFSFK